MKPKNLTIDDLAVMVQKGFNQMDERFTGIDGQFALVHQELKAIRKDLRGVVYRPEFEALQERVHELEDLLSMLRKKAA
jgi:archaellum component FlaC